MGLGYVEGVTHDYVRHGTTTLFAALDVATGAVFTDCKPRHRHQEFLSFLKRIDAAVPAHLDVHLIVDNYATRAEFVRQLADYRAIVSTSLHGCIFAHSFGIPVAPFVLTDGVFGGDFKFQDHYSALGIDIRACIHQHLRDLLVASPRCRM